MTAAVARFVGTPREHVVDPETLREAPMRPAELTEWLAVRRDAPIPAEPASERRHRTDIGEAARIAGELDIAEQQLFLAAELAARETPAIALRARIRLAHVWQWQGRYAEADEELADCVRVAATPADRAFAHQHAGMCEYDLGDVDRAAAHFQAAARWYAAAGAQADLVEWAGIGLDAADACRTAIAMATALDRLVPQAHARIRDVLSNGDVLAERPPRLGALVELRPLLLAGPVAMDVVNGLFRYQPGINGDITRLERGGWLVRSPHAVTATSRCVAMLEAINMAAGIALREWWGRPEQELARVDAVVCGAVGTSAGPVFDALATVDPRGGPAVRLFERCNALRYHRADAHAAAWQAVGLTATSVALVPSADPVRRDVETVTNRLASRPYRPLSTVERDGLVTALCRLADLDQEDLPLP